MKNPSRFKSSILFLLLNGKIEDILTPWHIIIDFQTETITIKKRNWYLIGVDEEVHAFKYIRRVQIDQHVFGADLEVKLFGGIARVFCLKKSSAKEIKEMLIDYNQKRKGGFIIS